MFQLHRLRIFSALLHFFSLSLKSTLLSLKHLLNGLAGGSLEKGTGEEEGRVEEAKSPNEPTTAAVAALEKDTGKEEGRVEAKSPNEPTTAAAATERNVCPQRNYPTVIDYTLIPGDWMRQVDPDMPEECFKIREPGPTEIIYVTKGEYLCTGGTAFLERLPCGHLMKTPKPNPLIPVHERDHRHDMRLEARIYQNIGENPRVPKMINWDPETDCLMMEYLENGDLREYIRQNHTSITPELRLRWAKQAAEGLEVLHAVGVVHCDISPRNFLLDSNLDLKISDFGGASLDGSKPSAAAGERFQAPGTDWDIPPVFQDDIFSLGSLMYLIMTNKYPFEEISSGEVEKLYERHVFPDKSRPLRDHHQRLLGAANTHGS